MYIIEVDSQQNHDENDYPKRFARNCFKHFPITLENPVDLQRKR